MNITLTKEEIILILEALRAQGENRALIDKLQAQLEAQEDVRG